MTRLRQRLGKLEGRRPAPGAVTFICTGVPRPDKIGDLDVAITSQGWVTKAVGETDEQFMARVSRGWPCAR